MPGDLGFNTQCDVNNRMTLEPGGGVGLMWPRYILHILSPFWLKYVPFLAKSSKNSRVARWCSWDAPLSCSSCGSEIENPSQNTYEISRASSRVTGSLEVL